MNELLSTLLRIELLIADGERARLAHEAKMMKLLQETLSLLVVILAALRPRPARRARRTA